MDFPQRKALILKELESRTKIAVEYDGFQSGMKPEDYFDALKSTDNLSKFSSVAARVKSAGGASTFKQITDQLNQIKGAMSDYAHKLALNSEQNQVDLTTVDPKAFDRATYIFEKNHKGILVVESPDFFVN